MKTILVLLFFLFFPGAAFSSALDSVTNAENIEIFEKTFSKMEPQLVECGNGSDFGCLGASVGSHCRIGPQPPTGRQGFCHAKGIGPDGKTSCVCL